VGAARVAALLFIVAPLLGAVPGETFVDLRVPILAYHSVAPREAGTPAGSNAYVVTPETFDAQMTYLRDEGISVVSLSALVDALAGEGAPLPTRAVVITFDDGWINQYRHALPVLRKFGYTATFFVFTNPIGRDDRFVTWDQLREMQRAGMTIGSHGWTHPHMKSLAPKDLQREVDGSRRTLRQQLNAPVDFFAYPFGEHPPDVEAAVRNAGYRAARGFPGGPSNSALRRWALHSVMVTNSLAAFRRLLPQRL
jgi:peptidoglycan/xylan/chitin deacetylase (PgdA/CDA1 family)